MIVSTLNDKLLQHSMTKTEKHIIEVLPTLVHMSREERVAILRHSPLLFAYYYFGDTLNQTPLAEFHYLKIHLLQRLCDVELIPIEEQIDKILDIEARGLAKTTLTQIVTLHTIVYGYQHYINPTSFDSTNSDQYLYEWKTALLTNKALVYDFGKQIRMSQKQTSKLKTDKDEEFKTAQMRQRQQSQDFETVKGIRLESHTTNEPVRGRKHFKYRPTLIINDDIENKKIVKSQPYLTQVSDFLAEARNGMHVNGKILTLANLISDYGNIAALKKQYLSDKSGRTYVIDIPILDELDKPTWKGKYTRTNKELYASPYSYKDNMESIEKLENDNPKSIFQSEFMNNPIDDESAIFKQIFFQTVDWQDISDPNNELYPTHINIAIDTALSKETTADFTAFAIDYRNQYYPKRHNVEIVKMRCSSKELLTMIKTIHSRLEQEFPIARITWGIEKTTLTKAILPFWEERHIKLHPLEHNQRNKEERILQALLHPYESLRIYHVVRDGVNTCSDMEDHLQRFPNARHDDDEDATSYLTSDFFNSRVTYSNEKVVYVSRNEDKDANYYLKKGIILAKK